jgi:hypothetical protein
MIIYQFGVSAQQCVNSLLHLMLQVESHHAIHPCVKVLGSVSVHYSHLSLQVTGPGGPGLLQQRQRCTIGRHSRPLHISIDKH